jgi:hypothetical protein
MTKEDADRIEAAQKGNIKKEEFAERARAAADKNANAGGQKK